MGNPLEQFTAIPDSRTLSSEKEIFDAVTNHSRQFDKATSETRVYPPEEIRKEYQTMEWKIGDTVIQAVGVMHVPETFLEFRQQIEKTIQESDVVVNEFAPEALGLYDKTSAGRLQGVRSKYNKHYNLEQLRQTYIKNERPWNLGLFHHEVELLAAKHSKDMAIADLTFSKNPEAFLQDGYLYAYGAEQTEEHKALLKKMGLYTSAVALAGSSGFIGGSKNPISRRNFLKLGLVVGAAAIAGVTPKMTETPPQTAVKKSMDVQGKTDDEQLMLLRDPKLAEALQRLAKAGYKKIAFIYGTGHLKRVGEYVDDPQRVEKELAAGKEVIERNNPDAFRIYRQTDGDNTSEKFIASEKKVWKRVH